MTMDHTVTMALILKLVERGVTIKFEKGEVGLRVQADHEGLDRHYRREVHPLDIQRHRDPDFILNKILIDIDRKIWVKNYD